VARVDARQALLRERARAVFGGGSIFMYDLDDEANVVLVRGRGSRAWNADGRERIDYHLGSGPRLVGHCHPRVVEAVQLQRHEAWVRGPVELRITSPVQREVAAIALPYTPAAEPAGDAGQAIASSSLAGERMAAGQVRR